MNTIVLSDLYDADRRAVDPQVYDLADRMTIPHPLRRVQYADGIVPCTHAKKHPVGMPCPWLRDVALRAALLLDALT